MEQEDAVSEMPSVEAPTIGEEITTPDAISDAFSDGAASHTSIDLNASLGINYLCFGEEDFPDVCIRCSQCMRSIHEAIHAHAI